METCSADRSTWLDIIIHFSYTRQRVTGALDIARQLSRASCFSICRAASQVERCVDRRHVRFRIEPGARTAGVGRCKVSGANGARRDGRARSVQLGYETTKLNIAWKWKALPTNTNPCQMAWW